MKFGKQALAFALGPSPWRCWRAGARRALPARAAQAAGSLLGGGYA